MPLASIADLNGPPEEVHRRINQAKQLSTLYDSYVNMMQDGHERAPGIHASELYPCARQAVYSCNGTPRKPQVSKFWKQRFKIGQRTHLMLQDDFHAIAKASATHEAFQLAMRMADDMDCTIEFQDEVRVSPELQPIAAYYQLYSSCDGVFTFRDRQTLAVVLRVGLEIKTEAQDGYAALKGPKDDHVHQAHLYMACLDLPLLWFFYINKNNQNNTKSENPYLIVFQNSVWDEMQARFREIHQAVAEGVLLPRVETIICEFCAWAYTCKPRSSHMHSNIIHQPGNDIRSSGKV